MDHDHTPADGTCPLCGAADHLPLGKPDATFTLSRCARCGFTFVTPRPSHDFLMEFYNLHSDYVTAPEPIGDEQARRQASRYHGLIRKYAPRASRVLEIGCLYGHLLRGLALRGYQVTGADVCEPARRFAMEHYGITVHPGEAPDASLKGSFDVVIISHVIEHTLEPVSFLAEAASYLGTGGILLVETPGLDSPLFALFGASYNMVRPPEHISFFSRETMARALNAAGLECAATLTYSYLWDQRNFMMYGALSFFKWTGILGRLRARSTPSASFGLAAPIPVRSGSLFQKAFQAFDHVCRTLNCLSAPVMLMLDALGRGMMLVAVGRKPGRG